MNAHPEPEADNQDLFRELEAIRKHIDELLEGHAEENEEEEEEEEEEGKKK